MSRPREHDEETREQLRAAAEQLFEKYGSAGVSVRALAKEVGTTTRAVYTLFGSRDGLLVDALASRTYRLLETGLDAQPETSDPAADLIECAVQVFRDLVLKHPALFRITFQRMVPGFEPGPELLSARASSFKRLRQKVARLEESGQLKGVSVDQALIQFQALCEGLGNQELRGDTIRILPKGRESETWRAAFTSLVKGFSLLQERRDVADS